MTTRTDRTLINTLHHFIPEIEVRTELPLTFDDIEDEYEYTEGLFIPTLHLGQRKLFIAEFDFLLHQISKLYANDSSWYTSSVRDLEFYVIYVGSAEGNHIGMLSLLFPGARFILFDNNQHNITIDIDGNTHFDDNSALYFRANVNVDPKLSYRADDSLSYRYVDYVVDDVIKRAPKHIAASETADNTNVNVALIESTDYKYYIFEGYFTNDHCYQLRDIVKDYPTYFISDIRTAIKEHGTVTDYDTVLNYLMQYQWHRILQPYASSLKFKLPYTDNVTRNDIHILANNNNIVVDDDLYNLIDYSGSIFIMKVPHDAQIRLQAYPSSTSTETRLWIDNKDGFDSVTKYRDIPRNIYERKFAYHNNKIRPFAAFMIDGIMTPIYDIGYCDGFDTVFERRLWSLYSELYNDNNDGDDDIIVEYIFYDSLLMIPSGQPRKYPNSMVENAYFKRDYYGFIIGKPLDIILYQKLYSVCCK